ncbi:MAG: hypothetical protein WAU41_15305 [Gaiellaceae bacterium]
MGGTESNEGSAHGGSAIVVATSRPWYGDQRLGAFSISLDGSAAGKLPPHGTLRLPCAPGKHRVRARQWWYMSPQFEVVVEPGQATRLDVDLVRHGSFARRMLTMMLTPWRGVVITPASGSDG